MRLPAKLFLAIRWNKENLFPKAHPLISRLMHAGQTAEALTAFRELRCPEASFYSGEMHR